MFDLSIIIIGYNTQKELFNLLTSINSQNLDKKKHIECIYVDDGSTDFSIDCFNKFDLLFHKKCISLKKNLGRVYATQKGIDAATGNWFLFIRSNLVFEKNSINEFFNSINSVKADVFMGRVKYTSSDLVFGRYLNHSNRGTNTYKHNHKIHYRHLLFGNSVFKSKLFKKYRLNENLKFYGGEELDLAEKIYINNKSIICFCKRASAVRQNHPSFSDHVERLKEFGENNLHYLSKNNQKLVLSYCFYLKKIKFLIGFWAVSLFLIKKTYKYNVFNLNYFLIRWGLLSAIMIGSCKSKAVQNFPNSSHLK